jgi:hypothetical protein
LQNVPGGVDIIRPNIGISFTLKPPANLITDAKQAVSTYGAAVDALLNSLPSSTRAQMQTYFNQRIIGGTKFSMPNWMKTKSSAKQYSELVTGNPDVNGQYNAKSGNIPGKLYTLDANNKPVPSPAHLGLLAIWNAIYNLKLNLADTATMLSRRIAKDTLSLSARINTKLNSTDTSAMLSTYFTSINARELIANKSNDTTMGGGSPSSNLFPTQLAVQKYVLNNAGTGVGSGTLSGTIVDATTSVKGKIQLAGDLGGTAAAPTVSKVGGVTATMPSTLASLAE